MRLQLRHAWSLLLLVLLAWKPGQAWAQSTVKYKRLRYDEQKPGITVDEDALEVLLELDNEDEASFSVLHDAISGASPIGLPADDTVTGASSTAGRGQQFAPFEDERWAYTAGYDRRLTRTTRANGVLHYSREDDYVSRGLTLGATFELNQKNTTIAPSVTRFQDEVRPLNDKPAADKTITSFVLDMSQVINRWNVLSLTFDYSRSEGYLTDPYKLVLVGSTAVDETRPDSRAGYSAQVGWRTKPFDHHAFDVRLRYYRDDWDIVSTTLKLKSLHELGEDWLLEAFYRTYQQTAAFFWDDTFEAGNDDPDRSADPRLSRFISNTLGVTAIYKLSEAWWLEGSVARYVQSASQGAFNLADQDALVTADVYSLAIQYRFW